MPFLVSWEKVLHLLFFVLLKSVTPKEMSPRPVNPVDKHVPNERARRNRCVCQRKWVDSLRLGPLVQLRSPAIFIAGSVPKACLFWPITHTRNSSIFKDRSISLRSASSTRISTLARSRLSGEPDGWGEVETHRNCIMRAPLVVRDREHQYAEEIIPDSSATHDAMLPVLVKVASSIYVLMLGGSYEMVHCLWSQLSLTVTRVNIDVTWSQDEVLVGNFFVLYFYVSMCIGLLVLCFSRSFWMGCTLVSLLMFSGGWKLMDYVVSNSRNVWQCFGCCYGYGRGPHLTVSVLRCLVVSAARQHLRPLYWDISFMLLQLMCQSYF